MTVELATEGWDGVPLVSVSEVLDDVSFSPVQIGHNKRMLSALHMIQYISMTTTLCTDQVNSLVLLNYKIY